MDTTGAMREMRRYVCHKEVWALKIAAVSGTVIMPADSDYLPIDLGEEFVAKHKPEAGGYYVQYADGYKSFSPAEAFENGYTPVPTAAGGGDDPIVQFFAYWHLPAHLQEVSRVFAHVAYRLLAMVPRNPERTVALRKLLEAKDAAVRARLFK